MGAGKGESAEGRTVGLGPSSPQILWPSLAQLPLLGDLKSVDLGTSHCPPTVWGSLLSWPAPLPRCPGVRPPHTTHRPSPHLLGVRGLPLAETWAQVSRVWPAREGSSFQEGAKALFSDPTVSAQGVKPLDSH